MTAYDNCRVGHTSHQLRCVHIDTRYHGQDTHDFPPAPDAVDFDVLVYDYERYRNAEKYCTGNDVVSESIMTLHTWEPFETPLVMDVLSQGAPDQQQVLDFGAHVGWYTIIAAKYGYRVHAYECDEENCDVIEQNAKLNDVTHLVDVVCGEVDGTTVQVPEDRIQLVKVDLEGDDYLAVSACASRIAFDDVNYVLLEVSPVFRPGDHYPELVQWLVDIGFDAYMVPHKGLDRTEEYGFNPLATLRDLGTLNVADVEGWSQENVLFERRGL